MQKTSVNVKRGCLNKLCRIKEISNESFNRLTKRFLFQYIRRISRYKEIIIYRRSSAILYQAAGYEYNTVTIELSLEEYELLQNVRLITRFSVSFLLYLAINMYADRLLRKLKTAKTSGESLIINLLKKVFKVNRTSYGILRESFVIKSRELYFHQFFPEN